jgi:hypothetical protein
MPEKEGSVVKKYFKGRSRCMRDTLQRSTVGIYARLYYEPLEGAD